MPEEVWCSGRGARSERFGATWQADVISGLVAFLAERAKAEALASLVHQLKTQLCTEEWSAVVPATCGLLGGIEPARDPVAWSALKVALASDLRNLPVRLIQKIVIGDKAELLVALVQIITHLERGADPLETLAGLRIKYESIETKERCAARPYSCSLQVFGIATEVLAPQKGLKTLADTFDNPRERELYLMIAARLLYEGMPRGIWEEPGKSYEKYTSLLDSLHRLIDGLLGRVKIAASDAGSPKARSSFASYTQAVSEIPGRLHAAVLVPGLSGEDFASIGEALQHLTRSLEHARAGEYVEAFVELQVAMNAAGIQPPAWFRRYGGFLAEVASAKSKDDMQHALEAAAAPVGAWRRKRGAGHRALTINGYVGGQAGYEWLGGDDAPPNGAVHGGLFAPIGVEASWGRGRTWSAGVLFSAIDLGALLDVRESTHRMTPSGAEKVDTAPNLGFRQIFSPGVYGVVGVGIGDGGIPLTFGVGFSLAPELRSISIDGGASREVNALRLNAFLALDITIFEL